MYKKTKILLQYETSTLGPQYENVADYVVKFGILGKEPKKKTTSPFGCYVKILVCP